MKLNNKGNAAKTSALKDKKPAFSIGKKKSVIEEVDPTTFNYTPSLPRVNVIPLKVTEKYEVKGIARKAGFIVASIAGIFVLVFAGGQAYNIVQNGELTALEEERSMLQAESEELQPYSAYQAAVAEKRTALSTQVATDVNMGNVYRDLYLTAEANDAFLTNINIQQQDDNGIDAGGCINPDPFVEAVNVIGCITLQGNSGNPEASKGLVEDLVGLSSPELYISPFISSIATADGVTNFDASISFTTELYTNQYQDLQLSIEELLAGATVDEEPVEETEPNNIPEQEETVEEEPQTSNTVAATAASLVPELTEENLDSIDSTATVVCAAEDFDAQLSTGIEDIRMIITNAIGESETDVDSVISTLQTTLISECGGE